MTPVALTPQARALALDRLGDTPVDLLVIGGGVTGAGVAFDAVTRGLSVGLVEAADWGSGTSSRSSRLVHGGLRYLQRLDLHLVREALTERDLLLRRLAPHLVRPVPFLYPLTHRVWERAYIGAGITLYDALATLAPGGGALPWHRHLGARDLARRFPGLRPGAAVGAVAYWDAAVDDARLVLTLVRTAAAHGAHVAARAPAVALTTDSGRVTGARVRDLATGREIEVRAGAVVQATGVWTEQTQAMATADAGLRVLASKGAHVVVPRSAIDGSAGLITQTETSVLFIIPWPGYWLIGTTDTPWRGDLADPTATADDVDYLLAHANAVLARPLTRADVIGSYAGLRPLLQPEVVAETAAVSREHTVATPLPGLVAIAGGKLTTYRVMARDAVDHVLGDRRRSVPSVTRRVPLLGAASQADLARRARPVAARYGWSRARMRHLASRYGTLLDEITALADADPSLARPLAAAPGYLRAEVVHAARYEAVSHLEDVLVRRTHLDHEQADRGLAAIEEIGGLVAGELGWDAGRLAAEIARERARCAAGWDAADDPTEGDPR